MDQAVTESACRQWGARGFRKLLRDKGLGARGILKRRERERDTGNFWEKGVSRWDSMGMRGNEAATQGKLEKKVCRGWDKSFFIKMEQISR